MKKHLILFILFSGYTCVFAQFKLNGKINNYPNAGSLTINIPQVYGFYKENTITIPVDKNGAFTITLPVKTQKFANLIFQKHFYTLLLSAGKDLSVELDHGSKKITLTAGTALPENELMQKIDLEEFPFFMENENADSLGKLNLARLDMQVIKPYLAKRDEKLNIINQSSIALADKKRIASEVKYIAYTYLDDFARTQVKNRNTIDSLVLAIFDNSNPKPDVFPAGPRYYAFIYKYLSYLETKAFLQIKKENIKPNEAIPYYGISLDSANVVVKAYGKPYWRWIGSTRLLPDTVTEHFTYQQILALFYDKDLRQAEALAQAFINRFPASDYNNDINAKINALKVVLRQNETNAGIKIFANYEKLSSIYDVIKTFKGKVVYLDVWGTWCGPCKEELKHLPQLKSVFKDKDVVFVYLDMDEEDHDTTWKEFIKINNLTGIHLRKNKKTIAPLWKELLANNTDKAEYYPQYFIFDKDGKLAVSKALRPSNNEALYKQINAVLNKN